MREDGVVRSIVKLGLAMAALAAAALPAVAQE